MRRRGRKAIALGMVIDRVLMYAKDQRWPDVKSMLRAIFGWRSAADYRFPNIRSLGGAILLFSFVLYPYVYLAARATFNDVAGSDREPAGKTIDQ